MFDQCTLSAYLREGRRKISEEKVLVLGIGLLVKMLGLMMAQIRGGVGEREGVTSTKGRNSGARTRETSAGSLAEQQWFSSGGMKEKIS